MQESRILEKPLYGITETATYLGIPTTTLRYWVRGRDDYKPVIHLPHPQFPLLSFMNLVEAHVLSAIRKNHNVTLPTIRKAITYISNNIPWKTQRATQHPLVDLELKTDGVDLFVDYCGELITLNQAGQLAMRAVLDAYLKRIEYDASGLAVRLYPFSRAHGQDDPRVVMIDPRISFGKPVVKGTGILTAVLAERFKAGEEVVVLSEDYGIQPKKVEEAIRYELKLPAAA